MRFFKGKVLAVPIKPRTNEAIFHAGNRSQLGQLLGWFAGSYTEPLVRQGFAHLILFPEAFGFKLESHPLGLYGPVKWKDALLEIPLRVPLGNTNVYSRSALSD